MTLDDIILTRRSVRLYQDRPVDSETLLAVLEAGRLAPSAKNEQRWHFTAVQNAGLRAKLQEACLGQPQAGSAPVTLVVWAENDRTMHCGQSAAAVDCSIALSFMILKATELGLGTCWLAAFDAPAVAGVLGLPEGAKVIAVSPLGWPAEEPAARPRKSLSEVSDIRM